MSLSNAARNSAVAATGVAAFASANLAAASGHNPAAVVLLTVVGLCTAKLTTSLWRTIKLMRASKAGTPQPACPCDLAGFPVATIEPGDNT